MKFSFLLIVGILIVSVSALSMLSYVLFSHDSLPPCPQLMLQRCVYLHDSVTLVVAPSDVKASYTGLRFLLSQNESTIVVDRPFFVLNESSYAFTLTDARLSSVSSARVTLLSSESNACSEVSSADVTCMPNPVRLLGSGSSQSSGGGSPGSSGGSGGGGGGSSGGSGTSEPPPVYTGPVAVFEASPLQGSAPLTVTFDATNSSDSTGIALYAWDFGDTITYNASNASLIQHIFNVGIYNVTLEVVSTTGARVNYTLTIHALSQPACSDGLDNDNDGAVDGADLACAFGGPNEDSLIAACQDGIDNDGSTLIDFPDDPGCFSSQDDEEFSAPVTTVPLWGLLNNGFPIAESQLTIVSLASDSQGNLVHLFSDARSRSNYAGRFNVAAGRWEKYTNEGWSDDTGEPHASLGTSGFGLSLYQLLPGFAGADVLFGLDSAFMKVGSGGIMDFHINTYNIKLDLVQGILTRWYNGAPYGAYNAHSLIWSHYGSQGSMGRSASEALFIKSVGQGRTSRFNYTATRYDPIVDNWAIWRNGQWNYTYELASFNNATIPLLGPGDLPWRFSPHHDAIVTPIPNSSDFLILYVVQRSTVYELRAARYDSVQRQWLTWDGAWTSDPSVQQSLMNASGEFSLASVTQSLYDGDAIVVPVYDDTEWRFVRYEDGSFTIDSPPFASSATRSLSSAYDSNAIPWIVYQEGSLLYVMNYSSKMFSDPMLITSFAPEPLMFLGLAFTGTTPVVYYQGQSQDVFALSNLNTPVWSHASALFPSLAPVTLPLDPLYGEQEREWMTTVKITVNNSAGVPLTFYTQYGPNPCGHITFDREMSVYCPHARTTAVIIYPLNYTGTLTPPYPPEEARAWGNFWEYQLMPQSIAVDNVRNKTYVSELTWWGGGSEAFPSGSIKIWDKGKKSEFIVNATFARPPFFNQTYFPDMLLLPGNNRFNRPSDTAIDEVRGILYVVESSSHRVDRFDLVTLQSGLPRYLNSFGSEGLGLGQFKLPQGIDVDSSGNVYVVDTDNSRIQKFNSSGSFISSWGGWGIAPGQFRYPYAISVDPIKHYVYVTDPYNARVQIFDEEGNFIYTFGFEPANNLEEMSEVSGIAAYNNTVALAVAKGSYRSSKIGYIRILRMYLP